MIRDKRIFLLVAPLLLLLDQGTKAAIRMWLPLGERVPLIPRFFDLVHAENTGAAFSLLDTHRYRLLIFSVVTLIAFAVILTVYRNLKRSHFLEGLALGFIFAGALGNFTDRLLFRSVTDFLEFYLVDELGRFFVRHFGTNRWPAFNVADMAILFGVALFLLQSLRADAADRREAATHDGA